MSAHPRRRRDPTYAPGWPALENISGELRFIRNRMEIANASGQVMGARGCLTSMASCRTLNTAAAICRSTARPAGPLQAFCSICAPPHRPRAGRADPRRKTQGAGALKLKLDIPLAHADATQVSGEYQFLRNGVRLVGYAVPPLSEVSGVLRF